MISKPYLFKAFNKQNNTTFYIFGSLPLLDINVMPKEVLDILTSTNKLFSLAIYQNNADVLQRDCLLMNHYSSCSKTFYPFWPDFNQYLHSVSPIKAKRGGYLYNTNWYRDLSDDQFNVIQNIIKLAKNRNALSRSFNSRNITINYMYHILKRKHRYNSLDSSISKLFQTQGKTIYSLSADSELNDKDINKLLFTPETHTLNKLKSLLNGLIESEKLKKLYFNKEQILKREQEILSLSNLDNNSEDFKSTKFCEESELRYLFIELFKLNYLNNEVEKQILDYENPLLLLKTPSDSDANKQAIIKLLQFAKSNNLQKKASIVYPVIQVIGKNNLLDILTQGGFEIEQYINGKFSPYLECKSNDFLNKVFTENLHYNYLKAQIINFNHLNYMCFKKVEFVQRIQYEILFPRIKTYNLSSTPLNLLLEELAANKVYKLDLSNALLNLKPKELKEIFNLIKVSKSLFWLNLSYNKIDQLSNELQISLTSMIKDNSSITTLYLNFCNIYLWNFDAMLIFSNMIKTNHTIEKLHLAGNNLNYFFSDCYPDKLNENKKFELSKNLSLAFLVNTSIQDLDISINSLYSEANSLYDAITSQISMNTSITHLDTQKDQTHYGRFVETVFFPERIWYRALNDFDENYLFTLNNDINRNKKLKQRFSKNGNINKKLNFPIPVGHVFLEQPDDTDLLYSEFINKTQNFSYGNIYPLDFLAKKLVISKYIMKSTPKKLHQNYHKIFFAIHDLHVSELICPDVLRLIAEYAALVAANTQRGKLLAKVPFTYYFENTLNRTYSKFNNCLKLSVEHTTEGIRYFYEKKVKTTNDDNMFIWERICKNI